VLFVKGTYETRRGEPQILVNYIDKIDLEKLRAAHENLGMPRPFETEINEPMDFSYDPGFSEGINGYAGDEGPRQSAQMQRDGSVLMDSHMADNSPVLTLMTEEVKTGKGRILEITLHSTGSKQKDKWRLRQIYNFLISTPGDDRFSFICRENGDAYRFDFPNDCTDVNDAMLNEIHGMVGEANVKIL
jgi:hypothetical protein